MPITVGTGQFEVLTALGVVLAKVIAECGEPVLMVASSDMNHYEDDAETRVKDALAIEQVLAMHPKGLFQTVREQNISMCGVWSGGGDADGGTAAGCNARQSW